jgi:hypothetical protein
MPILDILLDLTFLEVVLHMTSVRGLGALSTALLHGVVGTYIVYMYYRRGCLQQPADMYFCNQIMKAIFRHSATKRKESFKTVKMMHELKKELDIRDVTPELYIFLTC